MKIFIADVCNCLELSHFETFFYKNINKGNISLYRKSIISLDEFEGVFDWLKEEINRNPFQINDSMVLFYIPRNITKELPLDRYEVVVKMYISQLISRHLDLRFRYCCVFLDETDYNLRDDTGYKKIKKICEAENKDTDLNLRSDNSELRKGFFPTDIASRTAPLNTIRSEIAKIADPVLRDFYRRIYEFTKENLLDGDETGFSYVFFQNCDHEIKKIRHLTVPHFGGSITGKTKMIIKLVAYVNDFAESNRFIEGVNNSEFENAVNDFIKPENFDNYVPNYELIKQSIATYRNRLTDWLQRHQEPDRKLPEKIDELEYEETNEFDSFVSEIDRVSIGEIVDRVLNPELKTLKTYRLSDSVFSVLNEIISTTSSQLKAFGDKVVRHMLEFRTVNPMYEVDTPDNLNEKETAEEQALISAMNRYITNGLPGYSEELKLRQELDILDRRIKYLAERFEHLKIKAFLLTLAAAVLSIAIFYLGAQYTVFMKEYSWAVYGIYCLVCAAAFVVSYQLTKNHYMKRLNGIIDECKQLLSDFLSNYKKRAKEFEDNINSAMRFYCRKDLHNKLSECREEEKLLDRKFLWHKKKITDILSNLRFFDGFAKGVAPDEGEKPLTLDSFEDDAVHNEFYQMPDYLHN